MSGSKSLAAGAAIKQVTVIVFAVFTTNRYVALMAQAIILALFIRTETLLKLAHVLPPVQR